MNHCGEAHGLRPFEETGLVKHCAGCEAIMQKDTKVVDIGDINRALKTAMIQIPTLAVDVITINRSNFIKALFDEKR